MKQKKIILGQPHGGKLVNLIPDAKEKKELNKKAKELLKIDITDREASDTEMIAIGAYSPLKGFIDYKDYNSILDKTRLSNNLIWSIPITVSTDEKTAKLLKKNKEIVLRYKKKNLCILKVKEVYKRNFKKEAMKVYQTLDLAHPGVAAIKNMGQYLIAGKIKLLYRYSDLFLKWLDKKYRLDPKDSRELFKKRGFKTVVAFQTRNPVHRAHEYLQKCALEIVDGLLLHPIVGPTKSDDIPADVRMKCYQVLLKNYYPENRVILSVLTTAMRYAGPKEAIFHAIIRKNFGCTHFIVGRDHAGVGNYYGTYDAQKIFDNFSLNELGIFPLKFEHSFYCKKCESMASFKTCPHNPEDRVILSGTKVRQMLAKGQIPPAEFTRKEVAEILIHSLKKIKT